MTTSNNSTPVGGYFAVFAIGALAGAGIALLYAPRSGKETRDLIAKRARELQDQATDALDEAKEAIMEKKERVVAAVEAGRNAVRKELAK